MTVGDLIYNSDFDINCNIHIWKVTEDSCWGESGSELVWSTEKDGGHKPLLLDKEIKYMTIDAATMALVIEIE